MANLAAITAGFRLFVSYCTFISDFSDVIFRFIIITGTPFTLFVLFILSQSILNSGMLVLASVPVLVISVGLFIRLREMDFSHYHLFALIVLCNGLTAMPFVLQVLKLPMYNNMQHYEKLSQSLAIQGWNRFYLIEWHNLNASFKYALLFGLCYFLRGFYCHSFIRESDFSSLPYLLYQQLGSYRSDRRVAVTALLLLVFVHVFYIN